jgi:transcriptional regulator with XRE-family HTH domain
MEPKHLNDVESENQIWLVAFGEAITEHRKSVAMTQQELADRAGVHRTYISDIERGSRNVTVLNLRRIATALGTNAPSIFSQTDKKLSSIEVTD